MAKKKSKAGISGTGRKARQDVPRKFPRKVLEQIRRDLDRVTAEMMEALATASAAKMTEIEMVYVDDAHDAVQTLKVLTAHLSRYVQGVATLAPDDYSMDASDIDADTL